MFAHICHVVADFLQRKALYVYFFIFSIEGGRGGGPAGGGRGGYSGGSGRGGRRGGMGRDGHMGSPVGGGGGSSGGAPPNSNEGGFSGSIDTWNPSGDANAGAEGQGMGGGAATAAAGGPGSSGGGGGGGGRPRRGGKQDAFDNAGNWGDDFPAADDWDNEEYTGSLADTKVFTPSGKLLLPAAK